MCSRTSPVFSRCLAVEETATVGVTVLVCRNYSVIVRTTGVDQVQYTHLYMLGIHL